MKSENKKKIIQISKWLAIYLSVLLIVSAVYQIYKFWTESKEIIASIEKEPDYTKTELTIKSESKATPSSTILTTRNLDVPYSAQAPFSNWTVHEESCEEAAIYMYRGYLEGIQYPGGRVPDAEADSAYKTMFSWLQNTYGWGVNKDLTMTELGQFAKGFYGYTPVVEKNITTENIKKAISDGHPVIVPVMTHSLQNSMYGAETTYHVLFVKGYDAAGVYTNDAGVGNGPNKHYTWEILWQAIDAQAPIMGAGREMLYLTK
jgi:uncharacterized protein YvpB